MSVFRILLKTLLLLFVGRLGQVVVHFAIFRRSLQILALD